MTLFEYLPRFVVACLMIGLVNLALLWLTGRER